MVFFTKHLGVLAIVVLLGAGCAPVAVSTQEDQKAAESLSFSSGTQMVLRETFFGLGGKLVNLLGGAGEERQINLRLFAIDDRIDLAWSMTADRQTEASLSVQRAFDEQYANAPVGTKIPDRPEAVFEKQTQTGTILTTALNNASHIALPHLWVAGDQTLEGNSLLWLTKAHYRQLADTRETQINLGLFDDSLAFAKSLSDRARDLANWLTQTTPDDDREEMLRVKASPDWGTYELLIDDTRTTVRTIKAQNAFAQYTILANENNPLILEITVSPLSRGSLDVFNRKGLLESFVGYEVVEITTN